MSDSELDTLGSDDDFENRNRHAFYLSQLAGRIHSNNCYVGWWKDAIQYGGTIPDKFLIPTKLCLTHSEISESMEGERKQLMDDHLPNVPMIQVEIADAIIRLLDLADYLTTTRDYMPIGTVLNLKLDYNSERADHKLKARDSEGGKQF